MARRPFWIRLAFFLPAILLLNASPGVSANPQSGCQAIQQAINSLPDEGGRVFLRAGTYTCREALVIARDNVDLRGAGAATVLRLADEANAPVLVIGDLATPPAASYGNIHVSDLSIDGNRANQTHECWGGECDTGGLTPIRNNGVTIRGVHDLVVERVTVRSAPSGGLVTEHGCRRLTVRDFTASDNEYDGLAGYQTEDSTFSGLNLHHNQYAGLSFDIEFHHNRISNANLSDNGKVGIFMRDSRYNIFENIQIRNSGEPGVFLAQVDTDATKPALGNVFTGLVVSHSQGPGFVAADTSCVDNLVCGAQFVANTGGCISPDPAVSNLVRTCDGGYICTRE